MEIESYSQRLLNPFRGVQRVIRYGAAEAVTTDGAHWDIYVSNDELLRGLDHGHRVLISEIRFGRWSAGKGLKRGPLYPSEDFRRMERMGATVYAALTELHDQAVFPFRDVFELWLLDAAGAPLALLASVLSPQEMDLDLPLQWRPGYAAEAGFHSAACEDAGASLSRYINSLAGAHPAAVWVQRDEDGSGRVLAGINQPSVRSGPGWSASAFPEFFLGTSGHDALHRRLLADFHAWQAPCLLLLPGLSASSRRRLEQQARSQASEVERHFRLYPQCVDPRLIQAARVEAMLQRCRPQPRAREEALSTFYIELEPEESAGD
jgi:hypothetical protein